MRTNQLQGESHFGPNRPTVEFLRIKGALGGAGEFVERDAEAPAEDDGRNACLDIASLRCVAAVKLDNRNSLREVVS